MQCKKCEDFHNQLSHCYTNSVVYKDLQGTLLRLREHVSRAVHANPGIWEWTDLQLIEWKVEAARLLNITPPYWPPDKLVENELP